jgi:hypothetical protein
LHFNLQQLRLDLDRCERFRGRIAHPICYQHLPINQSEIHRCLAVLGVILRVSLRVWMAES